MNTHKFWNVLELRENDVKISAVLQVMDAWISADTISKRVLSFFLLLLTCVYWCYEHAESPSEGGTLK
jgi:hypothetical protein